MSEIEKPKIEQKERETKPKEGPGEDLNLEAVDETTIHEKLLELSPEEKTGNFTELIEAKKSGLEVTRGSYIRQYAAFLEAKKQKNNSETLTALTETLKKSRQAYLEAKRTYAETLVAAKKSELSQLGKSPTETNAEVSAFLRQEIFQQLVIDEEKILQEKQAAEYPPKAQGVLRRLYEKWSDLSTVKKVLVTSALATGLAVTSSLTGGIGTAGLLLFFSKTFITGLGQEIFSGLVGLGVNKLLTSKIERGLTKQTKRLRETVSLENLENLNKQYHQLVEKKSHKGEVALLASALSMIATGRAFSLGLNFLSTSSLFKGMAEATSVGFNVNTRTLDKAGELDTAVKPTTGLLKKIFGVFKKTNINDIDPD